MYLLHKIKKSFYLHFCFRMFQGQDKISWFKTIFQDIQILLNSRAGKTPVVHEISSWQSTFYRHYEPSAFEVRCHELDQMEKGSLLQQFVERRLHDVDENGLGDKLGVLAFGDVLCNSKESMISVVVFREPLLAVRNS